MRFIPAIDILGGRAVRLQRGDYSMVTDYGDPAATALRWSATGVSGIHVVDLEAARGGRRQEGALAALAASGVRYQLGGGIRSAADAEAAIEGGAAAVVVGSAFTSDNGAADEICSAIGPDKVVAAVDVKDGRARGQGWTDGGSPLAVVVDRILDLGVSIALVTGIERDGMLTGPDVDLLEAVHAMAPELGLIASGGVASIDDLHTLVGVPGVVAVVSGRALYEGRFSVEEALALDGVHG